MKKVQLTIDGSTNRQVKNPKTTAQTLQRILIKVVGIAYAKFKEICSHSFEGLSNGRKCSNRFRSVNLRYLREPPERQVVALCSHHLTGASARGLGGY